MHTKSSPRHAFAPLSSDKNGRFLFAGLLLVGLWLALSVLPSSQSFARSPKPTIPATTRPAPKPPRQTKPTSRPATATSPWLRQNQRWFRGPQPGMKAHPKALARQLARAYRTRGKGYKPRTHHFWPNGLPRYNNRLLLETSPYLLQHAHNPVNWYPWGKAAFARAKRENKPVFLSVGYSTCHWCHVMEKESFENPKIAAYLNKHYIAIKVDREERLDVDGIYMRAVQIFSRGGGGWPMSVWLTPARRPFFGGTYFPPKDRWGRRGFLSLLKEMHQRFTKHPLKVANRSYWVSQRIRALSYSRPTPGVPTAAVLRRAFRLYRRFFDPLHGGMRGRPKFPSSFGNAFLLRYARRTASAKARQLATTTLIKMARGGIYDQVGGGFHRYSVDARWLVPHFEKMLYDNALLAALYADAYVATQIPLFAKICRETLTYVSREMSSPQGAFYSATDADSEGHEGKYFVWTPAQLDKHLGPRLSRIAKAYWGVTADGNFEGKTILHVSAPPTSIATHLKITPTQLTQAIQKAKARLYQVRKKRIPPLRDTKIIASWNGLMISAYARAALALGQPKYARRAARAATFLLTKMRRNGRLFRTHKDGRARHNAYLEDYAFVIAGLLDLFEATQQPRWFREALALQAVLHRHYWDKDNGGYFRTSDDHESLLLRPKPNYDGAVPTGNSIQVMNLLRLFTWTTRPRYRKLAEQTLKYFGKRLKRWPPGLSEMLLALDYYHDAPKEIILIKPTAQASTAAFLRQLRRIYVPNRVLVVTTEGAAQRKLQRLFPLVAKKKALRGKVTAYVCMRRVCELPTTDPKTFAKQLQKGAAQKK